MRASEPDGKIPSAAAVKMTAMAIVAPPIAPAAAVPKPDFSTSLPLVRIRGGNCENIGCPLPIRRTRRQLVLRQCGEMCSHGEIGVGIVQLSSGKVCHGLVSRIAVGLRRLIPRKAVIVLLPQHGLEI